MRTGLTVFDVSSLLDEPLLGILATLRSDGSVLLSPVWHEWRDGGFNLHVERDNAKTKHLRRDPRATLVVAEPAGQLRGVEVRGTVTFVESEVTPTAIRIATKYVGDGAAEYAQEYAGRDVIVRLEPGNLRVWDFADEIEPG
jgi:PPOX class probable F420-dependent enzyme